MCGHSEVCVRVASEQDVDQLYGLIRKSFDGMPCLSRDDLCRDLSDRYELGDAAQECDTSFEFDMAMIKPNRSACQALLAHLTDGTAIGHLVYHFYYTPWRGRLAYIDDIFVEESHRNAGVGRKLMELLSRVCKEQNLVELLYDPTRAVSGLRKTLEKYGSRVLRNNGTDWSVYRVEF